MATAAQLAQQNPTGFNLSNGDPTYGTQYIGSAYNLPQPGYVEGDSTAATQPTDPYALWGGQANHDNYVKQIDSGLGDIRQTGSEAFGNAKLGLQGLASNFLTGIRGSQRQIDTSRNNNELNRMNGIQDILGYVRNGLQQGASRLASGNATESSATGALQRAYNQIGSQKARSVNNQAGLASNVLDTNQSDLNDQRQLGVEDFHRQRDTQVNQIGSDLRQKLAQLDQTAIGLNLPGRIAVDQEKQRLIDEGMSQLQGVDQWLQDQLGGITPESQDQVRAAAQGLSQAGTALPNPFAQQFSQQQVQGAPIDQLPLFTRNKKIT